MFKRISFIKRAIRALSFKIFNYIENNGNSNFEKNGERFLIEKILYSFKNIDRDKVVLDIGANTGEYSKIIKEKSKEMEINIDLYLFEPTKNCFEVISKKFKDDNNVYLNNFGVSDTNGKAVIYYDKEQSGLASLYKRNLDAYNILLNQTEKIELRRLDGYIIENKIKHIDFIKIDIEGHELKAFLGLGKYLNSGFIDYIQFEYGGANLDSHTSLMEMYKFLTERGFKIAKILPNGIEVRDYRPYMDNFMYANYLAISDKIFKYK